MGAPTVGVIGLGILGRPVAEELVAAGIDLVVRDVRPEAVAGLGDGATVASSVADVGATCDVVLVLVLVQTADQCRAVVTELAGSARPGTMVAIMATVEPQVVHELAGVAAASGLDLIDAPLAGQGVASVREHSMWILAGGEAEVVERLRPVADGFAGRLVHAGALGAGATVKLAHNVMVYLGYLAALEAVELGRAAGVADGLVAEVTRASGALSSQSEVWLDIHERRRVDPGGLDEQATFRTYAALLDKDLRAAVELAGSLGLDLPGARLMVGRGPATYAVDPGAVGGT